MTSRRMPALISAVAALALVASPAGADARAHAASACRHAGDTPTAANAAAIRRATLCLLNRERAAHRLPALHADGALAGAATRFARQMVRQRFFDHTSPGGSTMDRRIRSTSYARRARSWSLAENIAWGSRGRDASPAAIVQSWMRSAPHRANILDGGLHDVGLGIATGTPRGIAGATYVTDFGARRR